MIPRHLYLDQPCEVSIETLALCNANCTFCPYDTLARKGTEMSDALINRLIDEMSDFVLPFVFSPFKVNEPFLDPRLRAICETFLAKCPVGRLRLFTNGSALLPHQTRWVADLARVEHLWISLNTVDAGEHQALMRFKSPLFQRIAHHLDVLHNMVERGTFGHDVVVSRVAQGTGADKIFLRTAQQRWPRFKAWLIKKDSWLFDIDAPPVPVPQSPCGRWYELSICADGKAALCCMDGQAQFSIGNAHTQSLLEIYNGATFRPRREFSVNRHTVPVCNTCTY